MFYVRSFYLSSVVCFGLLSGAVNSRNSNKKKLTTDSSKLTRQKICPKIYSIIHISKAQTHVGCRTSTLSTNAILFFREILNASIKKKINCINLEDKKRKNLLRSNVGLPRYFYTSRYDGNFHYYLSGCVWSIVGTVRVSPYTDTRVEEKKNNKTSPNVRNEQMPQMHIGLN